jgi:competence protein ComEC
LLTVRFADLLRRHPRHVALTALIVGLVLSGAPGWAVAVATALVPLAGLATGRTRLALAAGALVVAGAWIGVERREAIDRSQTGPYIGRAVKIRGHVVRRERPTASAHRLRIRVTALAEGAGAWRGVSDLVQVRLRRGGGARDETRRNESPALAIGQEIRARGVLSGLPDRWDEGYADYLRRAGVHAVLRADSVVPGGMRTGPVSVLDGVRRRAEAGVGAGLEPRLSALATGIVLGQDERIPTGMVEQFQASGLAHLLAVSGQNVTLLAVLALPLLAALGLGRRTRLFGVLGLICVYVPLTGAGPSIMRAGAMGAAATVAQLSGRPASRWYALLLACAFTLAIDPRAWLDAGWQLSFAAVAGIFCLGPVLRRSLQMLPAPLAEGAALTVAATLATAPLLAFHFERLSVISLAANLIALPVVAPIMWIGTLAAAAGQVSGDAAALLNAVNGFCLAYLAAVARWSADLPGAVLQFKISSPLALAAAYLVPAVVVAGFVRIRRRRLSVAAVGIVIGGLLIVGLGSDTARQPGRFTVTFLDVGQGDSTLLQAPRGVQAPGGVAVLVDGGPPESGVVASLRSAGVRSLDLAVLTHAQLDHQGGLEAVLRELPVRVLLDGGAREPLHDRIVALARSRGTRVLEAHAGLVLRIGRLRIEVLSPPARSGKVPPSRSGSWADPNRRAVVALATYGTFDVLLTADAESDVTAPLALPDVDLLKVAHHGSDDPGLAALLERLHPEVAVIEVGASNRYGHPHQDTLATLKRSVPTVRRTDLDGDVTVTESAGVLSLATER